MIENGSGRRHPFHVIRRSSAADEDAVVDVLGRDAVVDVIGQSVDWVCLTPTFPYMTSCPPTWSSSQGSALHHAVPRGTDHCGR